jgi:hypothetical protein
MALHNRAFGNIAEIAGLPVEKRHSHVLKHSLASHLVAGNANLALIRQALGHRSIGSTMAYVGTSDGQATESLQRDLMGLFRDGTKLPFCGAFSWAELKWADIYYGSPIYSDKTGLFPPLCTTWNDPQRKRFVGE